MTLENPYNTVSLVAAQSISVHLVLLLYLYPIFVDFLIPVEEI